MEDERLEQLQMQINELRSRVQGQTALRDRWRHWGILRGNNVAGALNAISTDNNPYVTVLLGYYGSVYQKTPDTVISLGGDVYNRIQQQLAETAFGLEIATIKDGGFSLDDSAYIVTRIDSGVTEVEIGASTGGAASPTYFRATNVSFNTSIALDTDTGDPSSPADGWMFYRSDTDRVRVRANGAWVDLATTADTGGALKVINGGYYLIPAGPGLGTTVTSSASADTYGSWTEMRSASGNALYIVGISVSPNGSAGYTQIDIGTGGAGAETSISETIVRGSSAETKYFLYPIAVAANTRIACRVADEDASAQDARVYLLVVDQADVEAI